MKQTYKLSLSAILLAGLVILGSCKSGDPGPAGTNGTDGTNGTNGVGFDNAVKNGNVLLVISGPRPDNEENFTDSIDFKFSPVDPSFSNVYEYSSTDHYFYVKRFAGLDFTEYDEDQTDYLEMYFENYEDGESGDTEYYLDVNVRSSIITSDYKYFNIDDEYYYGDGQNITDEDFENYSYDESTGSFKLKVTFTLPDEENETPGDMHITMIVDATVYQNLNDGRVGTLKEGRAGKVPVRLHFVK